MRLIAFLFFLISVAPVFADVSIPHLEVELDDAQYTVAWRIEPQQVPVDVWVTQDPKAIWSAAPR